MSSNTPNKYLSNRNAAQVSAKVHGSTAPSDLPNVDQVKDSTNSNSEKDNPLRKAQELHQQQQQVPSLSDYDEFISAFADAPPFRNPAINLKYAEASSHTGRDGMISSPGPSAPSHSPPKPSEDLSQLNRPKGMLPDGNYSPEFVDILYASIAAFDDLVSELEGEILDLKEELKDWHEWFLKLEEVYSNKIDKRGARGSQTDSGSGSRVNEGLGTPRCKGRRGLAS
ncbi:hypothetical protein DSL72_007359 [Monilinia vaccinii-corymbosi]|uniref:Uncharacterized protein n=1 Tax=Monilinia vaccinii-corymbosi TaxID=61207 RepID=A0A8A3PML5_9HELO|nr:hypothetical protein DSL72_007359 [Monilinia vaccinii-corymbosi]